MDNKLQLPYYNNTNYPLAVKEQLSVLPYSEEESKKLKYHQFLVKEFFTKNPHQRGLLICHGMGFGKTRLAVAIADYYRKIDPKRKTIVLLSKSLEGNFRDTIISYTKHSEDYINKNYRFVSLNASNMFKQISLVNKTKEEIDYEKRLGDFMNDVKRDSSLNNSMLIIDEAHNLFNAITNGSKNAIELYDLIIQSTNLKLIFLTGTPVINDPFELVACFNMLRGYMQIDKHNIGDVKSKKSDNTLLFSENYEEFEDFFIDREKRSIKNKDKYMNRIYGLSSYYGDIYFPSISNTEGKPGFPKKLPTIIEKVPMSETQFARYTIARNQELEETKRGYKGKNARFSSSTGGNSTYRVKTRQISNYCIPEYALGPVRGIKAREKYINKITTNDLLDLDKYSPKMAKILHNILHNNKTLGMVYSQFVSGEGIAVFSRVLDANGYKNFSSSDDSKLSDYGDDIQQRQSRKYAILSGDIDSEERANIIKLFNQPENADGSIISLLLLSGAVAEGIDLKRIRHVHIMEPYWNYARINQVETRAIRYLSHEDLPADQRNVQVYIYLSDYPSNYPKNKIKELTTDVDLYENSFNNMKIINTFLQAIAESSIDCSIHFQTLSPEIQKNIHCMLCAPTNQRLFHPFINKDVTLPNACKPYSEKKISAQEIIYEPTGEKYYYKQNPEHPLLDIDIYMYNKKLMGYTTMPQNHPHYHTILNKIIENYKD